jgi:hypothetical protein
MTRSAAKFWWGKDLPDGVAYMVKIGGYNWGGTKPEWESVTYKEIKDKKVSRQQSLLEYKRIHPKRVAGYVWVFYNDTDLFGGWWIYIKTIREDFPINFRVNESKQKMFIEKVMSLFPLILFQTEFEYELWCEAFAKRYHHKGFKRTKNQGLAKCWVDLDENGHIADITLNKVSKINNLT